MWPRAETIRTPRLALEPLAVEHAAEMVPVLADPALYAWTGGEGPTLTVLEDRYAAQAAGASPDATAGWLNWIVRDRQSGRAVGYVQATLTGVPDAALADVAWVVGAEHQRQGIAGEAAQAMVDWLAGHGVETVQAFVHPGNVASVAVACRLGLAPTTTVVDDEVRWVRRTT
jgi:RimJ/RimL family protein N-acetyltransferase